MKDFGKENQGHRGKLHEETSVFKNYLFKLM